MKANFFYFSFAVMAFYLFLLLLLNNGTDEWLSNSKNGLTPEQIKYIRGLTDKVKIACKKE